MKKNCVRCHKEYDIREFMTKDGRRKYARCHKCRMETTRKSSFFDPQLVRSHLLACMGGRCARCGYGEFECSLEFHHIDASKKEASVGKLLYKFESLGTKETWDSLIREVSKCMVLCSNCHQSFHFGMWKYTDFMLKKADRYYFTFPHHATKAIENSWSGSLFPTSFRSP